MSHGTPFKWRHFEAEIMLFCVRCSLRSALSSRDLEEMMVERGLWVDHPTISRWVQRYAPELEKRCRPHLKGTTDSWRVDETSVKVKGVWVSLYRAVDAQGNTLEFLLSPTREAEAAKRFFHKTRASSHRVSPRVMTVDKNAAYPKAFHQMKATGALPIPCALRQRKSLNTLVEQDHWFITRLVKPGMGFWSFETAWSPLRGYEVMHLIRKGQMQEGDKGNSLSQAAFIARVFAVAASTQQNGTRFAHDSFLHFLQHSPCAYFVMNAAIRRNVECLKQNRKIFLGSR